MRTVINSTAANRRSGALVSCIMPTANRRGFVPEAIRLFLAQDYAERQLIILDDGADPVMDLVPDDPRIRYLRGTRREPVGAKRNRLCAEAKGELIAHWDDDDWYAPSRLSRQVAEISSGNADLCGLDRVLFFDPGTQRAFEYVYPAAGAPWLYGATLCYRKSMWERCPFPEIAVGEDTRFVAALGGALGSSGGSRIRALAAPEIYVGLIHPGNTGPKRTGEPAWRLQPSHRIADIAGDWAEAPTGSGRRVPVDPLPAAMIAVASPPSVCVGVYVHSDPARLTETLAYLRTNTAPAIDIMLLGDGPDSATRAAMMHLTFRQSTTDTPCGAAACFNRLLRESSADVLVFLESGSLVGPGWLETILGALAASPRNGVAGPSTNQAWSLQGALRDVAATAQNVAKVAAHARARYGTASRGLEPLYCLADFCYVVRRAVVDAIGAADEGYGLGPCWEMDYTARAVRSGFQAVWAQGAYVFRRPLSARRARDEVRLIEASRRRYQDRLCALKLTGARSGYAQHCRGEACSHFAPVGLISRMIPLAQDPQRQSQTRVRPVREPEADPPLVSCILPTRDRLEWLLQSIRYFQRQDYPRREMIIVDDGRVDLSRSLPPDSKIRYIHIARRVSIGEKRNRGCDLANGSIIAQWDDDDWYGQKRLTAQIAPLVTGNADITALRDTVFFDLRARQFWRCNADTYAKLFVGSVVGGTLVFRRSLYDGTIRYPDMSLAEDALFLRSVLARGARLAPVAGDGLFAYIRHPGNTWSFACGREHGAVGWTRCTGPGGFVADNDFYERMSMTAAALADPLTS
jgi:glycosyltransferase involved in cell wall biosynthesis